MKRFISGVMALAMLTAAGFTSCKSGDDDDSRTLDPADKNLVSSEVPSAGWSGDSKDGVLKFAPAQYDPEELNTYFAFQMTAGECRKAVLNIVTENAAQASQLARILNDGTWISLEEDEEEDYYYQAAAAVRPFDIAPAVARRLGTGAATRAGFTLPIPVQQEGNVIYVVAGNLQGLSAAELREVMAVWSGENSAIPDRVIFGEYENGVYTCKNMHGMNIDYKIETAFNAEGFCTRYTTSITLPTEGWARFYYEIYEEQAQDFEEMFGAAPVLSLNDRTVVLDAAIVGEVSEPEVFAMICTLDWVNNRPFICNLF